jgi:transcriptional regulator GlxA family with amidase domain
MDKKVIAFVVFPGMTPLDLVGPLQMIKPLENRGPFKVITVGETREPVSTDAGIRIQPEATFDEIERVHALVVPGGILGPVAAIANDTFMGFIRRVGATAPVLASMCTGSLILAAAGLLEGRRATTHWSFLDALDRLGAKATRARWVEDGHVITAAGVSAGIDMALVLASRLTDKPTAQTIQAIIEYDPEPPFGGIDWRLVEQSGLRSRLLSPYVPAFQSILADKPELLAKIVG